MPEQVPILVCGGSLAGLSAALSLKRFGLDALVLEKACFPRPKLCGEFLGPDSFAVLERLGVLEPIEQHAAGPIAESVFYPMTGAAFTVKMQWLNPKRPYGLGISRDVLDTLLMAHARQQGIAIIEQAKVLPEVRRENGHFIVEVVIQGQRRQFETPILIDASGRYSGLHLSGKAKSPSKPQPKRLGIRFKVHTPTLAKDQALRMFLFPQGYGGIQPLPGGVSNVCMLTGQAYSPMLQRPFTDLIRETIGQNPQAWERLADASLVEPMQTTVASNMNLPGASLDEFLRIGDAMMTLDPVTGSGMSVALQTGELAAAVIAAGLRQGHRYDQIRAAYHREYHCLLGNRIRVLKLFRPVLFSPALQRVCLPFVKPVLPIVARIFR